MPPAAADPGARLRAAGAAALHRLAGAFWPLSQQTAAAVVAWTIADAVGGARQPFFAPIAAVIALNAARGRRGVNALHLLTGVILGIGVGELTLIGPGGGTASMAAAVFVATALAAALGENRLVIAQAAAGAVLTVGVGDDQLGVYRIVDALIGAGVALVFTQLLFTPEPVALLRRAETAALDWAAAGLEAVARALAPGDAGERGGRLAAEAIETLRDPDDRVGDVDRMRRATTTLPRFSLAWRLRGGHSAREVEHADRLGLLGAACLMLARTAPAAVPDGRAVLVRAVREIAEVLRAL
ncbi:FUSC family protein, partial [Actinomadura sediminis]